MPAGIGEFLGKKAAQSLPPRRRRRRKVIDKFRPPSPDVSSGTRDLRGCMREPGCARGAQPMPAGIGEHLSASWPRRRRANPRSPGGPKRLWPMAGCRCGFQREIVGARGRPGETCGLAPTHHNGFGRWQAVAAASRGRSWVHGAKLVKHPSQGRALGILRAGTAVSRRTRRAVPTSV
jgi:hypothetical protein